jgi:large subunit ribosomal protein L29
MTPEELRNRNPVDLKTALGELKEELFKLNLQKGIGQLEKTHRLKEVRSDIARVHTILEETARKERQKDQKK